MIMLSGTTECYSRILSFVFGKYQVQILARMLIVLTGDFRNCQPLQANNAILP
jgi:hypothetical protein